MRLNTSLWNTALFYLHGSEVFVHCNICFLIELKLHLCIKNQSLDIYTATIICTLVISKLSWSHNSYQEYVLFAWSRNINRYMLSIIFNQLLLVEVAWSLTQPKIKYLSTQSKRDEKSICHLSLRAPLGLQRVHNLSCMASFSDIAYGSMLFILRGLDYCTVQKIQ